MKGRSIPARPGEIAGESTAWYASFWNFCAAYLTSRFGKKWNLSPEPSLLLHVGNRRVSASVQQNIAPFVKFLAELIKGKNLRFHFTEPEEHTFNPDSIF